MAADRFVDRKEIAWLLGVEERTITNWVRKHSDFPSRVRGRERDFPVRRCLQWRTDKLVAESLASASSKPPSDVGEAEKRKLIAEAELAEIKVAKARGEVVLVTVARAEMRDVFSRIRASLTAKPGEYAPRMLHLETVNEAIAPLRDLVDDVLAELQVSAGTHRADDLADDAEDGTEAS